MSAQPTYAPPPNIRDRLHRIAAAEQRLTERERALADREEALEAAEAEQKERIRRIESYNRKRARVAKAAGAELSAMNEQLAAQRRVLAQKLQHLERETKAADIVLAMREQPNVHGGAEGLYLAGEEARKYEIAKRRGRTGQ